jgi:hypothetical protein
MPKRDGVKAAASEEINAGHAAVMLKFVNP